MKVWHVYELVNSNGIVEYVGETSVPKHRLRCHISRGGKFYGRTDIVMRLNKQFNSKREAWDYQCILQKQNGLESDSEIISKAQTGKIISIETREKIGNSMIGNDYGKIHKGKKLSQKHIENIRKSKIGNDYGKAHKGRVNSAETREKISQSNKGRVPWNKGKTFKK